MNFVNRVEQKRKLQARWRRKRMALCAELLRLTPDLTLIDIGGLPELWDLVPDHPKVTLLNLPGSFDSMTSEQHAVFDVIEADIFERPELPAMFDIAFSNSVLEHVGPVEKQVEFAKIVRRAPAFWVQVPSPSFPIEQHCHALFWWQRGETRRERTMRRWSRRGDDLSTRFMRDTRPIDRFKLGQLFPEATIVTERLLGFEKSLYAFRSVGVV